MRVLFFPFLSFPFLPGLISLIVSRNQQEVRFFSTTAGLFAQHVSLNWLICGSVCDMKAATVDSCMFREIENQENSINWVHLALVPYVIITTQLGCCNAVYLCLCFKSIWKKYGSWSRMQWPDYGWNFQWGHNPDRLDSVPAAVNPVEQTRKSTLQGNQKYTLLRLATIT